MTREFQIIRDYFRRETATADLLVGVGDDGAVLRPREGYDQVIVTDTLVEGRHFPAGFEAADVGWRAMAVNLSDIAAMGAIPRFAFLNLTLPNVEDDWLAAFAGGFFALADHTGVALAGGDTTQGPLSITVTLLGEVQPGAALLRDGARAGDAVCVSGTPGDAAAGLELMQQGTAREHGLVKRFCRPEPRIALGRNLAGIASAAIDVSDGLLADLGHILEASGVGAKIRASDLPISQELAEYAENAWDYALAGGDDYELCFCLPPERLDDLRAMNNECGFAVIGEISTAPGLVVRDDNGNPYRPARCGWQHFSREAK